MKALVTGASGFIGGHGAAALLAGGAEVRAFDQRPPGDAVGRSADVALGDVLDPDAVARAVDGCDAVFHMAAVYSYRRADAALMETVNVEGTRVVLDAAVRGSTRRRIVHTSSCATCGPVAGRRATERDLPPGSELRIPYKRTKLEGERLALAAAAEGADVLVVNPTVPVGPGDERPTPTGKMVADVATGRARGYLARSVLNVVAVEDVAVGHARAFEHGRAGERYLLGGEDMSIRDVFSVIARSAGLSPPWIGVPWSVAYAAARVTDAWLRPFGREPELLLLDEVRSGRLPHRFDDAKARADLGYRTRPAAEALHQAARRALSATVLPPVSTSS
jgi:dihydroflavonol-4-reductase